MADVARAVNIIIVGTDMAVNIIATLVSGEAVDITVKLTPRKMVNIN